jgi:tetratricopeptide (TPR) repeat protein
MHPPLRKIANCTRATTLPFLTALLSICLFAPRELPAGTKPAALPAAQEDALQRGLNALKESHFEEALEALTTAENEEPQDPHIRNFRGIALSQLGKISEAEVEYREAVRLNPQFEDAWRNLGSVLWTQHRLEDSRHALEQALSLTPEDSFARYYLGRVELDAQHYQEAFRELKLSTLPAPEDPDFLLQAAQGHIALGEKDAARANLRVAATKSLRPRQVAEAASFFVAIGEYDSAVALLRTAANSGSPEQSAWARFDLALAYLFAGNYQQAIAENQRCVGPPSGQSPKPQGAEVCSLLGISEARFGQSNEAVQALRRAANLDPTSEEHWLNFTRELMETSRYPEAVSAAQEGIAANPKSYALQLRLGAAQLAAGKYVEAEASFGRLTDAGDPLPTSYVGLAQVLLREGRAEEAAAVLSQGEQKIGKQFLLSYFLGLSLDRAGRRQEAAGAFREAMRMNPNSAEAHLGLGKSELAAGQTKEAVSELQEALLLNPGNIQACRLLSQAYRRMGDVKQAEEYANASKEKPSAPEGDLLGDFVLPKWRMPEEW